MPKKIGIFEIKIRTMNILASNNIPLIRNAWS